jgi:hypothetical protein
MKTTIEKETEAKTDIVAAVQDAIVAAPSRAAFLSAHEKLADLGSERNKAEEETKQLVKDRESGKDAPSAHARGLLAGLKPSDASIEESLGRARRRLAVIQEAEVMQNRILRELRNKMSSEVNLELRKARQPLVASMAAALRELRTAVDEDAQVRAALTAGGVDLSWIDLLVFVPVSVDCDYSKGWKEARIAQGYAV